MKMYDTTKNPELGNMLFGTSEGKYPVCWEAFQELFAGLFKRLDPYEPYENEVFFIHPYNCNADCNCGVDALFDEWQKHHQHSEECWVNKYRVLDEDWRKRYEPYFHPAPPDKGDCYYQEIATGAIITGNRHTELLLSEAKKLGWNYNSTTGIAVICDCGVDEADYHWCVKNPHKFRCPVRIPNFFHKRTKFELKWYKYPFRDSYASQKLSEKKVAKIVRECLDSLPADVRREGNEK